MDDNNLTKRQTPPNNSPKIQQLLLNTGSASVDDATNAGGSDISQRLASDDETSGARAESSKDATSELPSTVHTTEKGDTGITDLAAAMCTATATAPSAKKRKAVEGDEDEDSPEPKHEKQGGAE
jgi:hypothetical protein